MQIEPYIAGYKSKYFWLYNQLFGLLEDFKIFLAVYIFGK